MRLKHWLPPVLWMALIVAMSSDVGSAEHSEHWVVPLLRLLTPWARPSQIEALHGLVRKVGHLAEYAVLASLWYRAFTRGRGLAPRAAAAAALAISLLWASLDEIHQSFVPSRTASARDVVVDGIGALLAMLVAALGWRAVVDRLTTIVLWTALIGGIAFLILNFFSDIPSGLLWLTPPLAAIVLFARTVYTRRRTPHQ